MAKNVQIDDRVWRKLQKKLAKAKTAHVRVGVLASKGGKEPHGDTGITMTDLAAIHEFGVPKLGIPERSFIRRTFVKKEAETSKQIAKLAREVVRDRKTIEQALEILGVWGAAEVRRTVTEGEPIPPPLADSTIAQKGSSRPLVDTGRLVGSVQYEVKLR